MKNKRRLISSIASSIVLLSALSVVCNQRAKRYDENIEETTNIEEFNDNYNDDQTIYIENNTFDFNAGEVDIEQSINSLNIMNDYSAIYKSFKVLRYVDMNNYEIIAIVQRDLDYVVDENSVIIGEYYTTRNAFNGKELLVTSDKSYKNIPDNENILKVISFGDLNSLRDIAISKGLSREYVDSIMPGFDKNKDISIYDIARCYVQLVKPTNRLDQNNVIRVLS